MRRLPSMMSLSLDAFRLGMEAQAVVGLRLFQAASGAGTQRENERMISEKVAALAAAQQAAALAFATGGPAAAAQSAMRVYRRAVSANRRRLSPK